MKKVLSYVILLVAVFCLVGCKPTNSNTGKIAEDNYTVETVENLKAQPEDSVKITFRVPFGTTILDVINEFKDEFETEYPSVSIKVEVIGGYDQMKSATVQDINGGTAPTMSVGYPDHFAEYLISKSLIALDKFINDPNVGYTEDELKDFLPGYIQENRQFDKIGTYVGLPFNKSTEALYYNVEFFEEFNLKVPETWDEYKETSKKIMEIVSTLEDDTYSWLPNVKKNLANKEFIPCLVDSGGNMFTTIAHQFGGEYTSSIYKSTGLVDVQRGSYTFNTSTKTIEGLTFFQDLAKEGLINMPDVWELQYASSAFCSGKVVMNIGSTGGSSYYSTAKCTVGVAPIPYYSADKKFVIQQGTNVCIFSQASDLEKLAAWLFIKHMLTTENTEKFAEATGYMPVRSSAYETDAYKEFVDGVKLSAIVQKATTAYASNGWNYFVDAAWAGSSNVRTECETALSTILVDKADIKKALDDAVKRIG